MIIAHCFDTPTVVILLSAVCGQFNWAAYIINICTINTVDNEILLIDANNTCSCIHRMFIHV